MDGEVSTLIADIQSLLAQIEQVSGNGGGEVEEGAVKMAKGENIEAGGSVTNNGQKDVTSLLLTPIAVTADNMKDTVIKDGFQKFDEVYKNVPADKRPSK